MLKIFLYTIKTAFFSTMIAAFIGIGIAFFTAKRNFLGRKFLLSLGIVPLCIPPLVIALGYVGFFGVNGFFSKVISLIFGIEKEKINFLYTTLGVVIAQGFYNFPFVTKIVSDAWERLPNETENAARLLGADEKRIFFTITLPRLSGAIAAACIPVFLFCFFSFMIVLLFSPAGNSTLEVELYHCIRTTLDFSKGVNIVILESLTSLLVVFIYSYIIRKNQYRVDGVSFQEITRYKIGRKPFENKNQIFLEKALFIFLIMLILLFFISPGISILVSAFTQKSLNVNYYGFYQFKKLFISKSFWISCRNSLFVGFITSFLCCFVAFYYSVKIRLNDLQKKVVFQIIPFLPMAVSSVVISFLVGMIFHKGNVFLLILMQTFLYWPIAYKQIQNGINQITKEHQNEALLISKNKFDCIVRFYLPSCKKVIITSFLLCFAISIGDATLPLVLSIPNFSTLALYTYRLAGTFKFNQSCACSLCTIFIILVFVFLFERNKKTKI